MDQFTRAKIDGYEDPASIHLVIFVIEPTKNVI